MANGRPDSSNTEWRNSRNGQSSAISGFLTVSVKTEAFQVCSSASTATTSPDGTKLRQTIIESKAILSVVPVDPQRQRLFNRITMMMKPFANRSHDDGDDEPLLDEENHHLLSKCVWFDVSLSRWTPSGCATLDYRRQRHHSFHEDDSEDDNNNKVLCECNHLTEFALSCLFLYNAKHCLQTRTPQRARQKYLCNCTCVWYNPLRIKQR